MDYQDDSKAMKLIVNLALNGFDVSIGQSEKFTFHPEVHLRGSIDVYDLDLLVRHAYGIEGGE